MSRGFQELRPSFRPEVVEGAKLLIVALHLDDPRLVVGLEGHEIGDAKGTSGTHDEPAIFFKLLANLPLPGVSAAQIRLMIATTTRTIRTTIRMPMRLIS